MPSTVSLKSTSMAFWAARQSTAHWKSLLSNTLTCSRQQVRSFTMEPSRSHCSPCTPWLWSTWPCWCHRTWCHWVIGGNDSTYWILVGCTHVGVWGVCVRCAYTGPATLKSGWVYTAWICFVLLPQDKVLVLGQHINLCTVGQDVFFSGLNPSLCQFSPGFGVLPWKQPWPFGRGWLLGVGRQLPRRRDGTVHLSGVPRQIHKVPAGWGTQTVPISVLVWHVLPVHMVFHHVKVLLRGFAMHGGQPDVSHVWLYPTKVPSISYLRHSTPIPVILCIQNGATWCPIF